MTNHKKYHPSKLGETGRNMELDYLYPPSDPRRRAVADTDEEIGYLTFKDSILQCLSKDNPGCYTGDELWEPPARWMNEVHYEVVQALGLEDWKNLTVIPTLKTAADKWHGIDFMFVYNDPKTEKETLVTIDLSMREKDDFKADILVTESGAFANNTFYEFEDVRVPDIEHASRQEEHVNQKERRRRVANLIADVINEKLSFNDDHYGRTINAIGSKIKEDIEHLMST